jgi:hypothetical protein
MSSALDHSTTSAILHICGLFPGYNDLTVSWFSPDILVFCTNQTYRHNTAKLLLEAVLNAHNMTVLQSNHLPALEYLDF